MARDEQPPIRRPISASCLARQIGSVLAVSALSLGCSGCGPRDPLDLKVDSTTAISLNIWKSNAIGSLSDQQLTDFNEAFQEIKFGIMAQGTAKGALEIEQAALEAVNGRTVRSILETGLDSELQRLQSEKAERLSSMRSNARMTTRPGDTDSQLYLTRLHDRQLALLDEEALQIARVKSRLVAAGLSDSLAPGSGKTIETASEPAADDAAPVLIHH
jgi:hypothetical protein